MAAAKVEMAAAKAAEGGKAAKVVVVVAKAAKAAAKAAEAAEAAAVGSVVQRPRPEGGDDVDMDDADGGYYGKYMEKVRDLENATTTRHCEVMRDLICLHLSRIEDAFHSKKERETIPQGYIAMYDGLQKELDGMPNKTASIAFAHDMAMKFYDISSFTHINQWLGEFFEKDCYIEGRDRRIMDEIFLHFFEQYGDVTFLLLVCGYKVRALFELAQHTLDTQYWIYDTRLWNFVSLERVMCVLCRRATARRSAPSARWRSSLPTGSRWVAPRPRRRA